VSEAAATITELCVGLPKPVTHERKTVMTGIFKSPLSGPVHAGLLHLDGDGQADLSVHGGRDKAIYVYPVEHYAVWAKELGRPGLEPSQFGENLTVRGMTENSVVIGDRYRLGSVIATVTQPRLPCFKLGIRMNDEEFPHRFLHSGRLGFYLRVEQQGILQKGDEIERLHRPSHGISIFHLWHAVFVSDPDTGIAKHALASLPHLDAGWIRRLKRIANPPSGR
jgi:MOSC domain-containing protein YiiM